MGVRRRLLTAATAVLLMPLAPQMAAAGSAPLRGSGGHSTGALVSTGERTTTDLNSEQPLLLRYKISQQEHSSSSDAHNKYTRTDNFVVSGTVPLGSGVEPATGTGALKYNEREYSS